MVAVALKLYFGGQDDTVQALKRSQPELFDLASEKGLSPTQIRALAFAIDCAEPLPPLKGELLRGMLRQANILEEFERIPAALAIRIGARLGMYLPEVSREARDAVRRILAAALRASRLQLSSPGR
jgi:hypothetical protein